MSTGPLSFLGRTRKSVFQDSTQLSGATMASASETLRPVWCCSIIARPASGFRLGKDDIRSTDSGSAHRCTFSTFPYRRSLQTGRPWSRCSRRWGHESDLVLPGAGPVVASWPASGFQLSGGRKTGLKCLLAYIYSLRDNASYRAAFSRVETTDARAKRPTMGGSNEPPFLLP